MPKPITVPLMLEIEVDPSGWASEYGTDPDRVRADIARYFAPDQLVHHLRDVAFRHLRGIVTYRVSTPNGVSHRG